MEDRRTTPRTSSSPIPSAARAQSFENSEATTLSVLLQNEGVNDCCKRLLQNKGTNDKPSQQLFSLKPESAR